MTALPCDDVGAFLYDSNGMLRYAGADQAAALGYAKLFSMQRFMLLVQAPRHPNLKGTAAIHFLEGAALLNSAVIR